MTDGESSRYGRYVGRVGALAVALGVGVGAAVVAGQGLGLGVAWADESGSGAGAGEGSAGAQADPSSPDTGGQGATLTPPAAGSDGSDTDDTDASGPETSVGSSGGVDSSVNDEGQSTDIETDTDTGEDDQQTGHESDGEGAVVDAGGDSESSEPGAVPASSGAGSDSGVPPNTPPAISAASTPDLRAPDVDSDTDVGSASTLRVASDESAGFVSFATTAEESELTTTQQQSVLSVPSSVVGLASTIVAALLSPLLAPGPSAPAEPPLLWALLGWVRREVTRTFFNKTPVAVADPVTTAEDTPKVIDVVANDADDDELSVTSFTQPANGTVVTNADGTFTYTPKANWSGTDTFTYTVSDAESPFHLHGLLSLFAGQRHTATGTVTVTVTAVNDAPVADDDSYTTLEDTGLDASPDRNVLDGDTDVDNTAGQLKAVLVSNVDPAAGSVTLNEDGTFHYSSGDNFHGTATFTYRTTDGTTTSNLATVTITVTPVNDAPPASPDSYTVDEDSVLTVPAPGVLDNDTDFEGDPLTAIVVTEPTKGVLNFNADGSFTYTPNENVNGTDSFTYKTNDGSLDGNTTIVNITINPVNDAPVVADATYVMNEGDSLTRGFGATDVDGDELFYSRAVAPAHGFVVDNDDGTFTYTPNPDFYGTDSFQFLVRENASLPVVSATVYVTVNPVNDAPVPKPDTATAAEGGEVTISVLANDTDPDGNSTIDSTSVVVTQPARGTATVNADGTVTYKSNGAEVTTDSFTYTVKDASGATSSSTTVSLTITPVEDSPTVLATVNIPGTATGSTVGADGTTYITSYTGSLPTGFTTHVTVIAPGDLQEPTTVDIPGEPLGQVVLGADGTAYQIAHTTNFPGGYQVLVIDAADPANAATVDLPGRVRVGSPLVVGADGTAYVTGETGGSFSVFTNVTRIDPADPENPTTVQRNGRPIGPPVVGADGTVYQLLQNVAASGARVAVIDPDDFANPTLVALPARPPGSVVVNADGIAYVTSSTTSGTTVTTHVTVIDPADPANPTVVDLPGSVAVDQVVVGPDGKAYQFTYDAAIDTTHVAVIDPADPQNHDTADAPGSVVHPPVVAPDGTVYQTTYHLAGNSYHVTVIDPADPANATTIELPGTPTNPIVVGPDGTAYAVAQEDGFYRYRVVVIDPANPGSPTIVTIDRGGLDALTGISHVGVAGDGTVFVRGHKGADFHIAVFNPADPANPTVVDIPGSSDFGLTVGADGIAYSVAHEGGDHFVVVLDATDPDHPTVVALPGTPTGPVMVGADGTAHVLVQTAEGVVAAVIGKPAPAVAG